MCVAGSEGTGQPGITTWLLIKFTPKSRISKASLYATWVMGVSAVIRGRQ